MGRHIKAPNASPKERSYNRSCQVQGIVVKFIGDLNLEPVTLWNVEIKRKVKQLTKDRTFFARIIGPGKVPEASVVLNTGNTRLNTVSNNSHGRLTGDGTHQELFVG